MFSFCSATAKQARLPLLFVWSIIFEIRGERTKIAHLKSHILPLLRSSSWLKAKQEWKLERIEIHDEMTECPCTTPIREVCYIQNTETGASTHVGNVCVNRFLGMDTKSLTSGLKRIIKDKTANASPAVIEYAWKRGYLYGAKERTFLERTCRKRFLSQKQMAWKQKINRRIVEKIRVRSSEAATLESFDAPSCTSSADSESTNYP